MQVKATITARMHWCTDGLTGRTLVLEQTSQHSSARDYDCRWRWPPTPAWVAMSNTGAPKPEVAGHKLGSHHLGWLQTLLAPCCLALEADCSKRNSTFEANCSLGEEMSCSPPPKKHRHMFQSRPRILIRVCSPRSVDAPPKSMLGNSGRGSGWQKKRQCICKAVTS